MLDYGVVKKDRLGNLKQRLKLCQMGYESVEIRDAIMDACSRDILFWVNLFGWIFEGRTTRKSGRCLPFITYEFQDDTFLKIVNAIQHSDNPEIDSDIAILKSRDMGASWMCLTTFVWFWLFHPESNFLMVSAKEGLVEKAGDPKALFTKIMYILDRLPCWMKPIYTKTKQHLLNRNNGSVIDGEATSGITSVGDRRLAILLDEFGKIDSAGKQANLAATILRQTADVTNCRIFNSTPEGNDSGFSVVCSGHRNVIYLHWSLHPDKRKGLYRVLDHGRVEVIDKEWHEQHPNYKFRTDPGMCNIDPFKGLRSPWYDREWDRRLGIKRDIAQELDMSFSGSGDPFFDNSQIAPLKLKYRMEPIKVMNLSEFIGSDFGDKDTRENRVRLWYHPMRNYAPPENASYTAAADIAAGTGSSDSALSIANDQTKEKVFEFYSNGLTPEQFADVVVAICEKFTTSRGKPFLIWDMTGPGFPFANRVMSHHHYGNVFYYKSKDRKDKRRAIRPGMPANEEIKLELFSEYRQALLAEDFITHSEFAYDEAMQYVYNKAGNIVHQRSGSTGGSDNKHNHGDIAYSEALLVHAMNQRPAPVLSLTPKVPYGSLAWRIRERRRRERAEQTMFDVA